MRQIYHSLLGIPKKFGFRLKKERISFVHKNSEGFCVLDFGQNFMENFFFAKYNAHFRDIKVIMN